MNRSLQDQGVFCSGVGHELTGQVIKMLQEGMTRRERLFSWTRMEMRPAGVICILALIYHCFLYDGHVETNNAAIPGANGRT